ncbi:MAG: FliI/YscN family ATPase [Henriciella sp.]
MSALASQSTAQSLFKLWGRVLEIAPGMIKIGGVSDLARVGNEVRIETGTSPVYGEILSVSAQSVTALLYSSENAIRIGDKAYIEASGGVAIGDHWLGQIINYRGEPSSPIKVSQNTSHCALKAPPIPAHLRRTLGTRLDTGLMATDTLLPICSGQRIGLFAGSGVGKSTLLGTLAGGVSADRVVIALIGERSREVNAFIQETLPQEVLSKCVIVAATASEPAGAKKRAAYCAMAAAEHFRDQGKSVLLLFDSLTRFAEAHREIALSAGESPALNAFPPSTVRVIAELVERAGPGHGMASDISAIFSVLVAGSDMEEPLADMVRGILDGHIILSREIAERGRYPAIDILRSISRALPKAASELENDMLRDYRSLIDRHDEILPMLRADLYRLGQDADTDRAIRLFSKLDKFAGAKNSGAIPDAFKALEGILSETSSD